MTAALASLALLSATGLTAAFLLGRKSLLANVVGFGLALEVGGQALLIVGHELNALLSSL